MPDRFMLDATILEQQRRYIYTQLKARLKNCAFSLVLPLQQIQTGYSTPTNRLPKYCFGYGEYWLQLVTQDTAQFKFDWLQLIYAKTYIFHHFALTASIQQQQKQQRSDYTKQRHNYRTAHYYSTNTQLLNTLAKYCADNFRPQQVIVFALSQVKYANMFIFSKNLLKSWHELRLYIDHKLHLHVFDANIGWLRSTDPQPSIFDITRILQIIFSVLQYEYRYNVLALAQHFILSSNRAADAKIDLQIAKPNKIRHSY